MPSPSLLYFMLLYTNKSSTFCQIFVQKQVIFIISSGFHKEKSENLAVFQLYTSAFSGILRIRQPARSKQVQFHARFCLNFNKFIREKELKSHESIYG